MGGMSKGVPAPWRYLYFCICMGQQWEVAAERAWQFMQGIVFSVRPPKKSWKNIANLSGGEKTLSSLSLVFALHHYKPTPLYVMDEIDAALGEHPTSSFHPPTSSSCPLPGKAVIGNSRYHCLAGPPRQPQGGKGVVRNLSPLPLIGWSS